MKMHARVVTVAALLLAPTVMPNADAEAPRRSAIARSATPIEDDAALEARARTLFERLLVLSPVPGPRPRLEIVDEDSPTARAGQARVIVARSLLRLCSEVKVRGRPPSQEARDTLFAFVLAHEIAHLARHDEKSFDDREATDADEKDADEKAVGRLMAAGFDAEHLHITALLRALAREGGATGRMTVTKGRAQGVRDAVAAAQQSRREWNVGWLLTVAGRFDQALPFYTRVAARYPYPTPMYTLALTRLHSAWRVNPCTDPSILEWLPPLRYDPRSQSQPFPVRSVGSACDRLRDELSAAAHELEQATDHPPAQIALAAVRLMQGRPSLDPTQSAGGVTRIGTPCPESSARSLLEADACHVSLLAQFELGGRSPAARQAAIEGLRRLREAWPLEPSLQFNLARLLSREDEADEAGPLWASFLETAGQGPYRNQAETSLSRVPSYRAPALPPPAARRPDSVLSKTAPLAPRLAPGSAACRLVQRWQPVTMASGSSLSYCGEWSGELLVRNREGILARSVAVDSEKWPGGEPPPTLPLFVTTSASGEELRIWEEEAWVFREKTPQRVVYFVKPQ